MMFLFARALRVDMGFLKTFELLAYLQDNHVVFQDSRDDAEGGGGESQEHGDDELDTSATKGEVSLGRRGRGHKDLVLRSQNSKT
jgi:hypothetical protein